MAKTDKRKTGDIGENVACKFLVKHGYEILDRNYLKKWGEIDVVAKKDNILHFIEVKTVSHPMNNACPAWRGKDETSYIPKTDLQSKSVRPTSHIDWYRPEDNVHPWKLKRLARAIQTYLMEKKVSDETEWQIDVIAVFLDMETKKAQVRITENVIL